MTKKLSVFDIADYFLFTQNQEAEGEDLITHLKLQKLCYYAQGFHLAILGQPLFDETISAWTHGPVVRPLWEKYREHGSQALPIPEEFDASKYDEDTREILDDVAFTYGQFSAWALRNLTHEEPPWKESSPDGPISLESMRKYFATLVEETDDAG